MGYIIDKPPMKPTFPEDRNDYGGFAGNDDPIVNSNPIGVYLLVGFSCAIVGASIATFIIFNS
jgi:hypothetical protein